MLDITKVLHESIEFDWQLDEDHDIQLGAEARVQNVFTALDVELAEIANAAEWFKVWKEHQGKQLPGRTHHQTVLEEYVDALNFFLLFSAKKQWTHLIVLDEQMLTDQKRQPLKRYQIKQGISTPKTSIWCLLQSRQEDFAMPGIYLKTGAG